MAAIEHAKNKSTDGLNQAIKFVIDGLDQAKVKVLRNLKSNADFEKLWKPQLHLCGCLCHGRPIGPSSFVACAQAGCAREANAPPFGVWLFGEAFLALG